MSGTCIFRKRTLERAARNERQQLTQKRGGLVIRAAFFCYRRSRIRSLIVRRCQDAA